MLFQKYKTSQKNQEELVQLQKEILAVVQMYVRPGGKLLYSTCTVHKKENEENTRWFLSQYPEYRLVREKQMIPGVDRGDGFYIAVLKKEAADKGD